MVSPEYNYPATAKYKYPKLAKAQLKKVFINKFMKMIETFKEEMKTCIKEVQDYKNKSLEEINMSLKECKESNIKTNT